MPMRTNGKDHDQDRHTPHGNSGFDTDHLDRSLREFDRTTGNSANDIDFSARWQAISRAMAADLANCDSEMGQYRKQSGDMTGLNQATGSGTGYHQADSFTLTAGSGTNLNSFKGIQEGMSRLG
jgi:hypothetical protein